MKQGWAFLTIVFAVMGSIAAIASIFSSDEIWETRAYRSYLLALLMLILSK